MREYAKVKKEREAEQRKKEDELADELKKQEHEDILSSNPLLTSVLHSEGFGRRNDGD